MPNSVDEEETQCLLASEDQTASVDDPEENRPNQSQHVVSKRDNASKMTSSASSNNLFSSDSDVLRRTFMQRQSSPSKLLSGFNSSSASARSASLNGTNLIPNSNEILSSDYVIPTLGRYTAIFKLFLIWYYKLFP